MATWNVVLFTKWVGTGRNDMAVALSYPAEWTDLGQQDDTAIQARSVAFCTMAWGKILDAVLTAIQADSHYQILARWDEPDGAVFDNRQSAVTVAQRDAFVAYFQTEFGINVAKIPIIQNSPGRTRRAVIVDIVQDLRRLT